VEVVVRLIEPATRVHDLPEPAVRPALAGIAQAFEARLREQPARQPARLVLADELAIEGDRQAEGRERPAKIDAGHLVARLVLRADASVPPVVAARKQVEERVEPAGPPFAAPLCRAGQADFET